MIELGELYAKEAAQIAPIVPMLDVEPGLFSGALTAPVIGVKHGLDVAASAAAESFTPILKEITPDSMAAWWDEQRRLAAQSMKDTRTDPRTVGAIGQMGHAVASVLTEGAIGGITAGPVGAVAAIGGLSGFDKYKELIDQKVDEATAAKVAGITGAVMGIGAALPPFLGGTLAKQIASGVGINVGLGIAERSGSAKVLEGYPDIAQHYNALDGTALAIDAVLGAAFPLGARALRAYGKPSIANVDDALDANRVVTEQTRDPALQATLEGIDRQRIVADDVSRQIMEGRPLSDVEVPAGVMDDTVPNDQVGAITAQAARAIDEMMVQEGGAGLRNVESDIATIAAAFKAGDDAATPAPKVMEDGAAPKAPPPDAEVSPDQFTRNDANAIVEADPNMKAINEDGKAVDARQMLDDAEVKYQQEKQEASLFKVAVACAIGVGE
jgi:hypothetical protein